MPATVAGIHLGPDTHANRPAANASGLPVGALYLCSDHDLIYKTDGSSWSTWATVGGGGGGGAADPIETVHGTPTTAFEFDTTSLTGLTAIGSPTTEDADTSVPGHYYIASTSTSALMGRYVAAPAEPWTAITKVSAWLGLHNADRYVGALFAGSSNLLGGVDVMAARVSGGVYTGYEHYWSGNPPAPNTNIVSTTAFAHQLPVWYAIRGNSATSYDFLISYNGYVWYQIVTARNPGYTIDSVGIGLALAAVQGWAAYDYLRIWNSALTFTLGTMS